MTSYLEFGDKVLSQSRQDESNKLKGAYVVDRNCSVCKKKTKHTFKFVQIRSADEGKTGIATCSICRNTIREN